MNFHSESRASEQGYLLIGLLFLAALILMTLAIAAPEVGKEIQREKEVEAVHRGNQYKRAIQLYYRKMGNYPASIDQLKNTNDVRFLRQEYVDPITGKKDWKLLHYGEIQMQTMGLFGQMTAAPGGAPVAGATPASGMPGASGGSAFGPSSSSGGSFGSGSSGSSAFGASSSSSPDIFNGSGTGSDSSAAAPDASSNTSSNTAADQTASSGSTFGSGSSGASAFGSSGGGSFGASSSSGGAFGSGASGPGSSASGGTGGFGSSPGGAGAFGSTTSSTGIFGSSTMGGAPIIGVTIPSKKKSIVSFRKQTEYDKWYFVYNPAEDVSMSAGGTGGSAVGGGAVPAGSSQSSGFGASQSGFGAQSGQSSFGNSFGASSTGPGSTSGPTQPAPSSSGTGPQ